MNLKKILCLVLVLAMCLGLAACGKSEGGTSAPAKNEPAEATPEFVYTAEYKTLVKDTKNYLSFPAPTPLSRNESPAQGKPEESKDPGLVSQWGVSSSQLG